MKAIGGCILAVALTAGAAPAAPALSLGGGDLLPRVAQGEERREPRISPAQAAVQARQQHGGKVLDVTLERRGSQPVYRVKLLKNGNVRSVRVPAD